MIILLAGECVAVWSLAAIGAAIGGIVPWRRWRVQQRDRQVVRARLFLLCPQILVDLEGDSTRRR